MLIPIKLEIERTTHTISRETRKSIASYQRSKRRKSKDGRSSTTNIWGLCIRTYPGKISLGIQPDNPITFYIKNYVLLGLKEKLFDMQEISDPQKHLAKFYNTCSMFKLIGDFTDD